MKHQIISVFAAVLFSLLPCVASGQEENGDQGDLKKILAPDLEQRRQGEEAARKMGSEAIPLLVNLLDQAKGNPFGQMKILEIISEFGEKENFSVFTRYLAEGADRIVQRAAAKALGALRDFRATPFLLDYLEKDVEAGALALAELGDPVALLDLLRVMISGVGGDTREEMSRAKMLRSKEQVIVASAAIRLGSRHDRVVSTAIRGLGEEGWIKLYVYDTLKKELQMNIPLLLLHEGHKVGSQEREARMWWMEKSKREGALKTEVSSSVLKDKIWEYIGGIDMLLAEEARNQLLVLSLLGTPVLDCITEAVEKGKEVPMIMQILAQMGKEAPAYFLDRARSGNPNVQVFTARFFGYTRYKDGEGLLIDFLNASDVEVVAAGLEALGLIQSKSPVVQSKVTNCLRSGDDRLLKGAMKFLVQFKDEFSSQVTSSLQKLVKDPEKKEEIRIEGLFCLLLMADRKALPDLIAFLSSEREESRKHAQERLHWLTGVYLGFNPAGSEEERAKAIEAWNKWWTGSGKLAALGTSWTERILRRNVDALRFESVLTGYIQLLGSSSWAKQEEAFVKLLRYRDRTIPLLQNYAEDSDESLRFQAVNLLATIGDKSVLPILFKALHDPAKQIRIVSAEGIRKVNEKQDRVLFAEEKEQMIGLLGGALEGEKEPLVKNAIAWALAGYGDTSGVPALIRNLKDRAWIRDEAFSYLKEIAGRNYTDEDHRRAFRFEANGSEVSRLEAARAWESWWKKNSEGYPVGGRKKSPQRPANNEWGE